MADNDSEVRWWCCAVRPPTLCSFVDCLVLLVSNSEQVDVVYRPHTNHMLTTCRSHTDHIPTAYRPHTNYLLITNQPHTSHIPTTYRPHTNHIPTTCQPHTNHILTAYQPHTDHIQATYWPHADHIPTTYQPHTDHILTTHRPPTDQINLFNYYLVHIQVEPAGGGLKKAKSLGSLEKLPTSVRYDHRNVKKNLQEETIGMLLAYIAGIPICFKAKTVPTLPPLLLLPCSTPSP